jgi:hypothetical protein
LTNKAQSLRFSQLKEIADCDFNVTKLNGSVLKQPNVLFSSILLQRAIKMKWNLDECELNFEIKDDDTEFNLNDLKSKDAIIISDLTLIGAVWNPQSKMIDKTDEELFNKLPPLLVYVNKKSNKIESKSITQTNVIRSYMTHMRQFYIIDMNINKTNELTNTIPYIVFDNGDQENQSRRLQRPIQISMNSINNGNNNNSLTETTPSLELSTGASLNSNRSPSLLVASQTIRQSLLRTNMTLQQIREVSIEQFPSQESQLSFKPMSPNAPPLPPDLQALVRSEKMKE